jgi:hypothetical protein
VTPRRSCAEAHAEAAGCAQQELLALLVLGSRDRVQVQDGSKVCLVCESEIE